MMRGELRQAKTNDLSIDSLHARRSSGMAKPSDGLVRSIERFDIINPLLAREIEGQLYVLDGMHRLAAARLLGIHEVPVYVLQLSDFEAVGVSLASNGQELSYIRPLSGAECVAAYEEATELLRAERSTTVVVERLPVEEETPATIVLERLAVTEGDLQAWKRPPKRRRSKCGAHTSVGWRR